MLNEPRLEDLKAFGDVIRAGSFSAAARATATPQTTISKRVAVLEEALGVKLLHRTTRRVNLTDDGQRVYQWTQKILETVADMQDDLVSSQGEPRGPIRVSASSRLGRDFVTPALSKLKQRFPALNVWLEIMDRRVDLVAEGFHLDVRSGEADEPDLIGHRIFKASRILCASPAYIAAHEPIKTIADLHDHKCILFRDRNEPLGIWHLKGPKGWNSVNIDSQLASNDNDVVRKWACDGHGVMIGADWFMQSSLNAGQLVRVLPEWGQPADVWAVSSARTGQSVKVRLFLQYLIEEMNDKATSSPNGGL